MLLVARWDVGPGVNDLADVVACCWCGQVLVGVNRLTPSPHIRTLSCNTHASSGRREQCA